MMFSCLIRTNYWLKENLKIKHRSKFFFTKFLTIIVMLSWTVVALKTMFAQVQRTSHIHKLKTALKVSKNSLLKPIRQRW